MNSNSVEFVVETLLRDLGIDLNSDGFRETPQRVNRFWQEFINRPEPKLIAFDSKCLDVVKLKGYNTWGLCPHHLLPVNYIIRIEYKPNGKVYGISKLPRIVDYLLRTLPLQEDLPRLVVEYLRENLNPEYIHCEVEGTHLCMTMRGIKAKDCTLETQATWFKGVEQL